MSRQALLKGGVWLSRSANIAAVVEEQAMKAGGTWRHDLCEVQVELGGVQVPRT